MNLVRPTQALHLIGILILSNICAAQSAFCAESQLNEYQSSVDEYARRLGQPNPEVKDYNYGIQLDVASVVSRSPMTSSCDAVPVRMTYKDSTGKLNTVQYLVQGKCRPQQE